MFDRFPKLGGHLPDHELVVATADLVVGVGSCEDIIGDVGTDVVAAVGPIGTGWDFADDVDELLVAELAAGIWVALHVVLAARPRPLGVPGDARGGDAVNVGALVTRARAGPPLVVVEVPASLVVVGELVAEVDCHGERGHGGELEHLMDSHFPGWWRYRWAGD